MIEPMWKLGQALQEPIVRTLLPVLSSVTTTSAVLLVWFVELPLQAEQIVLTERVCEKLSVTVSAVSILPAVEPWLASASAVALVAAAFVRLKLTEPVPVAAAVTV